MGKESTLEGIFQIPTMGFSNAYLAEIAPKNLLLIDTGTSSGGAKVLDYLSKTGQSPEVISEIILTHADADHSGSAAKLKRATGAKLAVGELDAPRVSGEMKKLKESSGIGNLFFGFFGVFHEGGTNKTGCYPERRRHDRTLYNTPYPRAYRWQHLHVQAREGAFCG